MKWLTSVLLLGTLAAAAEVDSLRNVEREVGSSVKANASPKQRVAVGDRGGIYSLLATLPHELVPAFDEQRRDVPLNQQLEAIITHIHDLYEQVATDAQSTLNTMMTNCVTAWDSASTATDVGNTAMCAAKDAYIAVGNPYYVATDQCGTHGSTSQTCSAFCAGFVNQDHHTCAGADDNRMKLPDDTKAFFDASIFDATTGNDFLELENVDVAAEITRVTQKLTDYFDNFAECKTAWDPFAANTIAGDPHTECEQLLTARKSAVDAFASCVSGAVSARDALEDKVESETNSMIELERMVRKILCLANANDPSNYCSDNITDYEHSFGSLNRTDHLELGELSINVGGTATTVVLDDATVAALTATFDAQILAHWNTGIGGASTTCSDSEIVADHKALDATGYAASYTNIKAECVANTAVPAVTHTEHTLANNTAHLTEDCVTDDPCQDGNGKYNGVCFPLPVGSSPGHRCACFPGWATNTDGTACEEIDACAALGGNPCATDANGDTDCQDAAGCTQDARYVADSSEECVNIPDPAVQHKYETDYTCVPPGGN